MKHVSTGLCPDCSECASAHNVTIQELNEGIKNGTLFDEGGFSSMSCDFCNTGTQGTRYVYHYRDDNDEVCHGDSICVDCFLDMEV